MKPPRLVSRQTRVRTHALLMLTILLGCAAPANPTPSHSDSPAEPARAVREFGGFRVVFEMPTATWRAGQPISGTARLERLDGGGEISGSGGGPIGFEFAEVGGRRRLEPAWDASCARHELTAAAPLVQPLSKSGGVSDDDPDAAFWRDFLHAPVVALPNGQWDITAVAWFSDGPECAQPALRARATLRVTIIP